MNTLCVQVVINQCSAWNTKSPFKQKRENSPMEKVGLRWLKFMFNGCAVQSFHTLYGFWSPQSVLSFGTMRGKTTDMPRYTETAVLLFFTQFSGFLPPSDEAVLFLFMSPPFKAPVLLSEAECWWSSQGSSLLLGSRISLVPLNNEVEYVYPVF